MGVSIYWRPPDSISEWDQVKIYKSDDGGSTYALEHTQASTVHSWYDEEGDSTNYYKIRFYNSVTLIYSDYSDPIQSGEVEGYCTITDVRRISGLTTSMCSDEDLYYHMEYATSQLNADVNIIREESVTYIDAERSNKIDGSNTVFYVRKPWIGDLNNDGEVTAADIQAYTIDNQGTRTDYTVSAINDSRIGKFTLSSAPTTNETLYVRYAEAPLDEETPHPLVKLACACLAGAWGYSGFEAKKVQGVKIGKITISKQSEGFEKMELKYQRVLARINDKLAVSMKFPSNIVELSELIDNAY